MTSASDNVARRYFEALGAQDLDAAVDCGAPGGVDRLVGSQDLIAPEGIRTYFSELFAAFPDFSFEILQELADGPHTTVRWRARGTFAGPGTFQGIAPNGARMRDRGLRRRHRQRRADRAPRRVHGQRRRSPASSGCSRRSGSKAQARLTKLANARPRRDSSSTAARPERIADGVWLVRGGFPQGR